MNKICSIFLDNSKPVEPKIIAYLKQKYNSVILTGNQMTTQYHQEIPYIYYNYFKYNYETDIIFQNLKDIIKFENSSHKIGYIYNCESHNIDYNIASSLFKKIHFIISDDKKINQEMLEHIFGYSKEMLYV